MASTCATQHLHGRNRDRGGLPGRRGRDNDQLLEQPCDVLLPAALDAVITERNAPRIQALIVAEGSQRPHHSRGRPDLARPRKVTVIPDILCNAGGVVVQPSPPALQESEIISRLQEIMARAFTRVWQTSQARADLRTGALMEGVSRAADAHVSRGLYPAASGAGRRRLDGSPPQHPEQPRRRDQHAGHARQLRHPQRAHPEAVEPQRLDEESPPSRARCTRRTPRRRRRATRGRTHQTSRTNTSRSHSDS